MSYDGEGIRIGEWPQPLMEIEDKWNGTYIVVRSPEDVEALLHSCKRFLDRIKEVRDEH